MKRLFSLVSVVVLAASIVACAKPAATLSKAAEKTVALDSNSLIGLSMPTHSDESWIRHSSFTIQYLKEMGYTKFDEQWAEDVVEAQVSQIENLIVKGAKILIIAAVNGEALGEVLMV